MHFIYRLWLFWMPSIFEIVVGYVVHLWIPMLFVWYYAFKMNACMSLFNIFLIKLKKSLFAIFSLLKMSTFLVGKLVLRPQKSGNLVDWVSSKFQMINAKTASGWICVTSDTNDHQLEGVSDSQWLFVTYVRLVGPDFAINTAQKGHIFFISTLLPLVFSYINFIFGTNGH